MGPCEELLPDLHTNICDYRSKACQTIIDDNELKENLAYDQVRTQKPKDKAKEKPKQVDALKSVGFTSAEQVLDSLHNMTRLTTSHKDTSQDLNDDDNEGREIYDSLKYLLVMLS